MQQIKCSSCQFTKFFVNSVGETSLISCSDCGASFVLTNQAQAETPEEPVEEEPKEIKKPEVKEVKKEVSTEKVLEGVGEPKPIAKKLSAEEKEALLKQMDEEGSE